jgi:hypothetical protein
MWRGYDILGSHAAWQPSADVSLFDTGFSLNVWGSMSISDDDELRDLNEIDYTIAYGTMLFEEERYAMDVGLNYIYYDFPNAPSDESDTEEVGVSVAMPSLLRLGKSALVPSYYIGRLYPTTTAGPTGGVFHILGLAYDLPIPGPRGTRVISFSADTTYNTGAFDADAGWSHATFGISTAIPIGPVSVAPSVNYKASFEDTVNDEDELWAGLSVSYGF